MIMARIPQRSGRRDVDPPNVYKGSHWGTSPRTVYYYHLTPVEDERLFEVKAYYYERESRIGSIKNVIRQLALNARACDAVPPQCGKAFDTFKWRRKSYIAILIDSTTVQFDKDDAVTFYQKDGSFENHTFFDGDDFDDINLATAEDREDRIVTAVYFINHMKRAPDGIDLYVNENQLFHFKINYHLVGQAAEAEPDRFPDSGGTNMGPPVPPP
jgi:hypothetical protein